MAEQISRFLKPQRGDEQGFAVSKVLKPNRIFFVTIQGQTPKDLRDPIDYIVDGNSIARTLSARYYKDGSEILVSQGKGKRPRRLTPRECARLMGFPDDFIIPVSDTQAYRQFGNSVIVPVMKEVARIMVPHVKTLCEQELDCEKQEALCL